MKILITGCAGFIGFHVCLNLLKNKNEIYGIDNLNEYYDLQLKKDRLKKIKKFNNFSFFKIDIKNKKKILKLFKKYKFNYVLHFAAQAGVRYSVYHPRNYLDNNVTGFFNLLDAARIYKVKHFIFASSSSVYGNSKIFPLNEESNTDRPLSFYSATKKSNEVMAHSYSNIYKLPCTGIRFFTIYGPYGRPDMSIFKFTNAIIRSKKLDLFNKGNHLRDFTYIDDAVTIISKIIKRPSFKSIPYRIFNIASGKPKGLKSFLKIIQKLLGKKPIIRLKNFQKGDVYKTHASINLISKITKYKPNTNLTDGISHFVKWFKSYHKI